MSDCSTSCGRAFAIAYRMLGSVSEAEDVVQEALLRVHQALDAGKRIASPRAFVATVTTKTMTVWPSGEAAGCNPAQPGSTPGAVSNSSHVSPSRNQPTAPIG